jgi:hypothetical protein
MTNAPRPVTLNDIDRDSKLAWVYCNACGRERDVPSASYPRPSYEHARPCGRQAPHLLGLRKSEGDCKA